MTEDLLAVFLGLLQGGVIFPLTLYLGLLIRRDLSQRYATLGSTVNIVAPLAMMVVWIIMSYLAADSLLNIIANSLDSRLKAGKLWVISTFLGLIAFAVTSVVLNKKRH